MVVPETNKLFKTVDGELHLTTSYSQIESFETCPYKWYLKYVEGVKCDIKQVALAYGSTIHEVLEDYFNSWGRLKGKELSERFNEYAKKNEIPWTSPEEQIEDMQHAAGMIKRIASMKSRLKKGEELSTIEKLFVSCKPIGVEEPFEIKYKLPKPIEINGKIFEHIYIIGFIDLNMEYEKKNIYRYLVDHKSGRKLFDKKKLDNDLQFPIYSFYMMRKYGTLPTKCYYHFTRSGAHQEVVIDKDRINKAVEKINHTFSVMYDFDHSDNQRPVTAGNSNFPLCYWCDYGREKLNMCPHSSRWEPPKKKEEDGI